MLRWRNTYTLLALYGLGLGVRVCAGLSTGMDKPLESDEQNYYSCAVSLSEGKGYSSILQQSGDGVLRPTAYRMPGTALAMALTFKTFGASILVARWTAICAGSLSVPLIFLFAQRVAPLPCPMIAAVACAFYPTWVFNCLSVLSEPFFLPALLCAILLTLRAVDRRTTAAFLIAGLGWSAVTMIRPHGLPMALVIGAYLMWRIEFRAATALMVGTFALLIPWLVRNQLVMGHPVLLATEGGETLLGANNPYVVDDAKLRGTWIAPMHVEQYREHLAPIRDEVLRDKAQRDLATRYLRENPEKVPMLVGYKLWRWLRPVTGSGGIVRLLVLGSYGSLVALLAWGAYRRLFTDSAALHIVLLWTFVLVTLTAVYWGNFTRGRLPLEIAWIPWGAWSAISLARSVAALRPRPVAAPAP